MTRWLSATARAALAVLVFLLVLAFCRWPPIDAQVPFDVRALPLAGLAVLAACAAGVTARERRPRPVRPWAIAAAVLAALLLAVGFMENGRYKTATGFALLAAVCREETPVYAASLGLFWMLSGEDRRRFRLGLGVLVVSIALEAFFSLFLMRLQSKHTR